MTLHYEDNLVRLHSGDCLDVMATLPDSSVDAIVTDPPYGLGFMGKAWDDLPPGLPWAQECLRVLKPGGHLLAFGGTRTWHRLAVAVEDAGFEMRDSIAWLYGSGFPKSKQHLKPAFEPVVVARKRGRRTHDLNVDACRVGTSGGGTACSHRDAAGDCLGHPASNGSLGGGVMRHGPDASSGRWPANVVLDEGQADALDRQSGGASRFFYCAKATAGERPKGDDGAAHPTVKPLTLMRWLVRLVTPAEGLVLEPFAGSGTTVEACAIEGFRCVAIEQETSYLPLIEQRLRRLTVEPPVQGDLLASLCDDMDKGAA